MEKQILRIKKPGGSFNKHTHITDVYVAPIKLGMAQVPRLGLSQMHTSTIGLTSKHGTWMKVEDVIREIEGKISFYYTDEKSKKAYIEVYPSIRENNSIRTKPENLQVLGLHKYIRTIADSTKSDNLLSLPNDSLD